MVALGVWGSVGIRVRIGKAIRACGCMSFQGYLTCRLRIIGLDEFVLCFD